MRLAMVWRNLVGVTSSALSTLGPRIAAAGAIGLAGSAGAVGSDTPGPLGAAASAASTSRLVMRPPGPVPFNAAKFRPLACARRFAKGEALMRPLPAGCGAGDTGGVGCGAGATCDATAG